MCSSVTMMGSKRGLLRSTRSHIGTYEQVLGIADDYFELLTPEVLVACRKLIGKHRFSVANRER